MSINITLLSDIHGYPVDVTPNPDGVLILAGDIEEAKRKGKYNTLLSKYCSEFKHVILVPGNHEYYGKSIHRIDAYLKGLEQEYSNLNVLLNETVVLDGVEFIGSTLWTNIDNNNPVLVNQVRGALNDYRHIRYGTVQDPYKKRLHPNDTVSLFYKNITFIKNALDKCKENGYTSVIVTHHAPCFLSVPDMYKSDPISHAYYSDLSEFILDNEPDFWCHGHIHNHNDYVLGKTRIMSNPYGYQGESTGYTDFNFIISGGNNA